MNKSSIYKESDIRIAEKAKSYRVCGSDLDLTIEECDKYIQNDMKWRNQSIEDGNLKYSLPASEYYLGQKMKIKQELINKQSQLLP